MSENICLITGVGDGTGAALARHFANGGYQVAMLARNRNRSDNSPDLINRWGGVGIPDPVNWK